MEKGAVLLFFYSGVGVYAVSNDTAVFFKALTLC